MPIDTRRLSKFLSLVLRHQPERLGLALDADGFVPLAALVEAARRERAWSGLDAAQVREVVAQSDKQRFEIDGDRIRARYGHSVAERVTYPPVAPPALLYHGTSPAALAGIRSRGLRRMSRQYVHLSVDSEQARQVGRRHAAHPVVLTVRAKAAHDAGVRFYRPEARLYLADQVPPAFIDSPPAGEDQ
jgi:putative RNA 2'-phosphotransferase